MWILLSLTMDLNNLDDIQKFSFFKISLISLVFACHNVSTFSPICDVQPQLHTSIFKLSFNSQWSVMLFVERSKHISIIQFWYELYQSSWQIYLLLPEPFKLVPKPFKTYGNNGCFCELLQDVIPSSLMSWKVTFVKLYKTSSSKFVDISLSIFVWKGKNMCFNLCIIL